MMVYCQGFARPECQAYVELSFGTLLDSTIRQVLKAEGWEIGRDDLGSFPICPSCQGDTDEEMEEV